MMIRQHVGADEELDPDDRDFVKKGTDGPKRKHETLTSELENLTPPGLKPMKQAESFAKWRKFVPPCSQDEVCPEPAPEMMKNVRKLKQDKQKETAKARTEVNKRKKNKKNKEDNEPFQQGSPTCLQWCGLLGHSSVSHV